MGREQGGEPRPLSPDEALSIVAKHGIIIHAKPIAYRSWVSGRVSRRYLINATLYLPFYMIHIEVDVKRNKERVWIEPATQCNNSCNCGGGY